MSILQVIFLSLTAVTAAEPYKNPTIGVELTLPNGATVVATSDTPPSCMIQGGAGQHAWHLKLDRMTNTDQKTPKELVSMAYERQKREDLTSLREDKAIPIGDTEGWWIRSTLKIQDAEESTLCWLAIPAYGNQVVIASILTTSESWQLFDNAILTSLKSIRILDPAKTLSDRILGLDTATTLLSDLNAQTLGPAIGQSSWRQIKQFKDGDVRPTDIGYAHISSRIGTQEDVGTASAVVGEKGLVVEVRSRIMPDEQTNIITDTVGLYWMSFDGKEELWSSTTTRWKGKIKTIMKETGLRNRPTLGSPTQTLLLLRQDVTSNRQLPPVEIRTTEPWLPKTLTWVLGPILNKAKLETISWRTLNDYLDPPTQTMREDRIDHTELGCTVTTRLGDSDAVIESHYDDTGTLLRRTLGGGIIIFGSNEALLRSIWEPKGLW
ncbi:MAG: hypothetical protein QGI78_06385 [Phycisphaerales bacterium]|jgi:hypothetical protein|nr:hypothetical protein [Phycisphaerales bacterium]